jgi:sulfhydrogenase subunit delta
MNKMNAIKLFKKEEPKKKPRVAIHSITGCAGCQLVIYFIRDKLLELLGEIDLVSAPMIKGKNEPGPYDICFVEGMVATEGDLENLKKWREESTFLVAWGTCATHGNVPGIKIYWDEKEIVKKVYSDTSNLQGKTKPVKPTPIETHVKVDYSISGCPPDEIEFLRMMQHFLMKIKPKIYTEPVCVECTQLEIKCLLEDGKECLGPMIRGGCNALCPAVGHGCTGCHGPLEDANIPQVMKLLEQNGISKELIKQRLQKYAGLKFEELGVEFN